MRVMDETYLAFPFFGSRQMTRWLRRQDTLDASVCVRAVRRAIPAHGVPEIFNTDQGCQFTSAEFTQPLLELGVRLSMDGKGRCLDNVFVERLWRSLKHEEVYLKRYESVVDAHAQIGAYLAVYNERRPHSSHGHATPSAVYHAHHQTKQASCAAARAGGEGVLRTPSPARLPQSSFRQRTQTITENSAHPVQPTGATSVCLFAFGQRRLRVGCRF